MDSPTYASLSPSWGDDEDRQDIPPPLVETTLRADAKEYTPPQINKDFTNLDSVPLAIRDRREKRKTAAELAIKAAEQEIAQEQQRLFLIQYSNMTTMLAKLMEFEAMRNNTTNQIAAVTACLMMKTDGELYEKLSMIKFDDKNQKSIVTACSIVNQLYDEVEERTAMRTAKRHKAIADATYAANVARFAACEAFSIYQNAVLGILDAHQSPH